MPATACKVELMLEASLRAIKQSTERLIQTARSRSGRTAARLLLGTMIAGAFMVGLVHADDLNTAIRQSLQGSPAVAGQGLVLEARREQLLQAENLRRPTVQAEMSVGASARGDNRLVGAATTESLAPRTVAINLDQPLYTGGRITAAVTTADAQLRLAEVQLRQAEAAQIFAMVRAWAAVRRDRELLEIRDASVTALTELLVASEARFTNGEASLTEVAEVQARLAREQAALSLAQAALRGSHSTYVRVNGADPPAELVEGAAADLPASLDEAVFQALHLNPVLMAARIEEDIARGRLDQAEADSAARVSLQASASESRDQLFSGSETSNMQVGVRVQVPLWSGGQRPARSREGTALVQAARQRALDTEREVVAAVHIAWANHIAQTEVSAAAERQLAASALALRGVRAEFLFGQRDQTAVLDRQDELLEARSAVARARHDRLVAFFGVFNAIGSLDATSFDARPAPAFLTARRGPTPLEQPLVAVQERLDGAARPIERTRRTIQTRVVGEE